MNNAKSRRPGALVIGGTGALGREVCRRMAEGGYDIALTYNRSKPVAEELCRQLEAMGAAATAMHLDLASPDQARKAVAEAARRLGGIESMIVASGLATAFELEGRPALPTLYEITPDVFDRVFDVNVRGVFFACQECARVMMAGSGTGRIVIVGSVAGVKISHPPADYACSKAALWGMVQALSKEIAPDILVNMVAPGVMEGGIAVFLTEQMRKEYLKHCSMNRYGKFPEIANAVAFLAGERNTYITGQAVVLDGGL